MKAASAAKGLGIGLAFAIAGVEAFAMQWAGGNSLHQSGTWTGSAFVDRGNAFVAPTQFPQFGQPGHSIIQPYQISTRDNRAVPMDSGRGSGFPHGMRFGHGRNHFHGHRHLIVVFANGAPYWFPVYTEYPYGYVAPLDTSSTVVSDTPDAGYVPSADDTAADSGTSQETSQYSDLGWSWGQDLRREVATWDQFVAYLKTYIVTAPASAQADFREAFIDAYQLNGAAAYDKAATEAAGRSARPASRSEDHHLSASPTSVR